MKETRKPISASEFVASHIRQAILSNELTPNSRIPQHALAAELGVSHVPLREAIQKLVAEGFLTSHPRRGAFVMPLSRDDVKEIFDLRLVLEVDVLKNSIPNLEPEQLKALRNICAKADNVTNIIKYGELNKQFHIALYAGAIRPRQMEIIQSLWSNAARYSSLLRINGEHFEQSQHEHGKMIEFAAQGDIEGAINILSNHLMLASEEIIAIMQKKEINSTMV